ncbi:hypothetical protein [Streptomyces sp. NBC_00344]|uniref:hypothetical protein n=1 Tax=Streptomyces sp. NBC_00344 TaxID=2975720 RepID=UPI002E21F207
MSLTSRAEEEVRRILDTPHPPVPADLAIRARERGSGMLRRRTAARRLLWLLLTAALVAFVVWATVAQPWAVPPSQTTPPVEGF